MTSTRNHTVRQARQLRRSRIRRETGLFLAEGPNAVEAAADGGIIQALLVTQAAAAEAEGITARRLVVADHIIDHVATTRTPQGMVAVCRQQTVGLKDLVGQGVVVVLHEASDPGNVGAVVRTVEHAGGRGVVLTQGSVDPFNPKAVRAAAGAIPRLGLTVNVPLEEVAVASRHAGARLVALHPRGSASVFEAWPEGALTLLFGSEAHGLPESVLDMVDETRAIPRKGPTESLNLAASVAVALYAAVRADGG